MEAESHPSLSFVFLFAHFIPSQTSLTFAVRNMTGPPINIDILAMAHYVNINANDHV